MNEEDRQFLQGLQEAYAAEKARNLALSSHSASSIFSPSERSSNLIEWQLELDNLLERIDHLLRGHELKFNERGDLVWQESTITQNKIFNEYGVQEILRILSMYLNRNTILSNYDEATINWKVYDLGIDLSDLVYMKYEEIFDYKGADELSKKIKLYPIIIRELIDTVHSAYLRALNGGERTSLREARTVTQTEPLGKQIMYPQAPTRSFSLLKPTTWFGR